MILTLTDSTPSRSATLRRRPLSSPNKNNHVRNKFFTKIGIVDGHYFPASSSSSSSSMRVGPITTAAATTTSTTSSIADNNNNVARLSEPLKYNHREERLREQKQNRSYSSSPASSSVATSSAASSMFESSWTRPNLGSRQSNSFFSSGFSSTSSSSDPSSVENSSLENNNDKANNSSTQKKKKKQITFQESVTIVPIPMRNEYSDRIRSRLWNNALEIHENAARNTIEFSAERWDWRNVYNDEEMYICCITGDLIHPVHSLHDFTNFGAGNDGGGGGVGMNRSKSVSGKRQKKKYLYTKGAIMM